MKTVERLVRRARFADLPCLLGSSPVSNPRWRESVELSFDLFRMLMFYFVYTERPWVCATKIDPCGAGRQGGVQ